MSFPTPPLPHSRLHLHVWSCCSLRANPSSWQHSPCHNSGSPAELLAVGGTWALEALALNPLHHCCRYHHCTGACLNSGPVYRFHQHQDQDSEKVFVDVCRERVGKSHIRLCGKNWCVLVLCSTRWWWRRLTWCTVSEAVMEKGGGSKRKKEREFLIKLQSIYCRMRVGHTLQLQ